MSSRDMNLLKIAARVAAGKERKFLLFTSGSGAAVWELPADADMTILKQMAEQKYNSEKAWRARGGDGTAYVLTEQELIAHESESTGEPKQTLDEALEGIESFAPADMGKAQAMLVGKLDALTGEEPDMPEDDGPPGDDGPPWDTLEEKRGLK